MENNYQLSRIHNYINGLMSKEEMHALEKEALVDPFLKDAMDGYGLQHGVDAKSLSLMQQRLHRRVAQHAQTKNKHYYNWQRLAVGMVAAVMFVTVSSLLLIRYLPTASNDVSVTEVELMDMQIPALTLSVNTELDGRPITDWSAFEAYISENFTITANIPTLLIQFDIDSQGVPYNLAMNLDPKSASFQEIVDLLIKGPKWQGKKAELKITPPNP